MPQSGEAKSTLKQLGSAAVGMVGALALNEALGATFKEIFGSDSGLYAYAVIVSLFSIMMIAILKLKVESWAEGKGGERGKALVTLFRVSFCLLSAKAWGDAFETSDSTWTIFGVALGLTFALVIAIILSFMAFDKWNSSNAKASWPGPISGFITYFLTGLVLWMPITFGFVTGVMWSLFFETLIKDVIDSDGARIVVAFVYAVITIPLAIGIILITNRVKDKGWCCPGRLSEPCCGLENKVAEPLVTMFEGEASAIMAFAWDAAIRMLWYSADSSDESANGADAELWMVILYAVVATILGVGAVLLVGRCV
eukprot:TRINITY_DN5956_c3_g1_i2.p1 TRINITY_DN5956_c3_g1~~TRINITY_DN5956_c3_g1_i2.p1  ORF type:complete len:312 (+),score=52.69 TRINITY_DN5956_c3_g1_i2:89-1024(+)